MAQEKTMTGYPSIDKPQEKFYSKSLVREIKTEQTVYELISVQISLQELLECINCFFSASTVCRDCDNSAGYIFFNRHDAFSLFFADRIAFLSCCSVTG